MGHAEKVEEAGATLAIGKVCVAADVALRGEQADQAYFTDGKAEHQDHFPGLVLVVTAIAIGTDENFIFAEK